MNKPFNFTQSSIDALPLPPKEKRAYYKDEKEKGLILDVRPSGTKSFYLYRKINGKPERIYLGPYPDMKIPEARALAAIKKGEIAHGKNPQDDKRKIRQEITLGDLFNDYMTRYSKPNKKSWIYDEREIPKYLGHWFKRKISSIQKHDIQKYHEEIRGKNGLYQANRILERIRSLYNKAIEWGWDGENPTKGIRKFKEKARDRFIQPAEMPFLFAALDEEENQITKDYVRISLMTGARKSNVIAMRWEQIDWDHQSWRIPETKNGEPVTVPLIPQAIEILSRRRRVTNGEWVFPGHGKSGHLADPKKAWERIRIKATLSLWREMPAYKDLIQSIEDRLKKQDNYGYTAIKLVKETRKEASKKNISLPTGLLDLRLHDIRRTLGSYQAITGASLPIIGKSLGHKSQLSTAIYARLNLDPVRASISKAADLMLQMGAENND